MYINNRFCCCTSFSFFLTLTLALSLLPPQADAQTPTCVKWGWGAWEVAPRYEGGPPVSAANTCIGETRPTHRRRPIPVAADGSSPCNGTVTVAQPPVLKTGRNASWSTTGSATVTGTKDCADTRPLQTFSAKGPARSGDKDKCKFDDGGQGNAALLFNKDAVNGSEENKPCILRSLREGRHIHLAWLHPTPADREYQRGYGGIPIPLVPGSRFKHWLGQLTSRNNGKWCHFDEDACRYEHTTFTCDEIKKTVPDPDNPGNTKEVSYSPKRYKTNTPGTTTWEMNKIDKAPACDLKYYQLWSGTHLPLNLCTPAIIVDYDGDGDGCKDEVKPKPECEPADQPCNTPVVPPVTPPVVTPPTPTCDWETGTWRTDPHNSCRQVRDVTKSAACGTNTPTGAKPAASRDDPSAGPSCCAKWKTDFNDPAVPGNPQEGWRMGFDSVADIPACFGNQQVTRQCETDKDFCKKSGNQSVCRKNTPAQKPNPNDWLPALKPDEICKGDKQTQTRQGDTHRLLGDCPDETRELEGTKVCGKEDGVCGAAPNHAKPVSGLCDAGTADTPTIAADKITWTCKGVDGGTDASCETPVKKGVCAATPTKVGDCDVGNPIGEDSINKTWYCDSTPPGVAAARSKHKCSWTGPKDPQCGVDCPVSGLDADDSTLISWHDNGVDSYGNRRCIVAIGTGVTTSGGYGANAGNFTPMQLGCNKASCGATPGTCGSGQPNAGASASSTTWQCISGGGGKHGDVATCGHTPATATKVDSLRCMGTAGMGGGLKCRFVWSYPNKQPGVCNTTADPSVEGCGNSIIYGAASDCSGGTGGHQTCNTIFGHWIGRPWSDIPSNRLTPP